LEGKLERKKLALFAGSILLVLAMVLPLAAACGGGGTTSPTPGGTTPTGTGTGELKEIRIIFTGQNSKALYSEVAKTEWFNNVFAPAMEPYGYKIVYEPHYQGEIFPGDQQIEALQMGNTQWGSCGNYAEEGWDPRVGLFFSPLLWLNHEHTDSFFKTPEAKAWMDDLDQKRGVHVISHSDYPMGLLFRTKLVKSLEDMKGLKIRTMTSRAQTRSMELLGAVPVIVSTEELTFAMSTGMMDGIINALHPAYFPQLGYLVYMHYALEFPITNAPTMTAVNSKWYYALPDPVRKFIDVEWPKENEKEYQLGVEDRLKGIKIIRETVKEYGKLSDAEFARWETAIKPLYDEIDKKIGGGLMAAAIRCRTGSRSTEWDLVKTPPPPQ